MSEIVYPQPEAFAAAISKTFGSEEFGVIVKAFGVSWSDINRVDEELQVHEMSMPQLGIRFTFEDEGVLLERK